ncbi:hypothetical protein [Dyella sp.]|jgi:hypothetical protein|uniref:hypothetical protein n=1 Tax=Dyella sp. TaxID=1869338 RepID=UPI002D78CAE7|nr:hypothetical protein [Dyella sp.]HET6432760.1 hypothetical protein [Dyella sp.]
MFGHFCKIAARGLLLAVLAMLAWPHGAQAQTTPPVTVTVTDTWPQGDDLTLGRNQNFYLRLGYRSAAPAGIWIRPYFRGQPAKVGTSPSARYTGEGEALGWFFFMRPGDEVDEVRITAGDDRGDRTPVVATYPVHLTGGFEPVADETLPDWVQQLRARDTAQLQAVRKAAASEPTGAETVAFFSAFMLAMVAIGLLGLAAPAWALWRWRGGWRVLASIPAALMVWTVLNILVGVARDSTSHNLWPFEILMFGGVSAASVAVMALLRSVFRRDA